MQVKIKNLPFIALAMLTAVGAITAIMTWANLAASASFMDAWVNAYIFAVLVMLPVGGMSFLIIGKFLDAVFPTISTVQKQLAQGVIMAVIMETMMAVISILNSQGYESISQFSGFLLNTLAYALPLGIVMSCLVSLVIKPRIQRFFNRAQAQANSITQ